MSTIIKCKICGGDIELSADKTFGTCEYCGSTMTLPKVSDEQRAAVFNRGNYFRRIGEFDKALAVYERIIREDETDAEAHWCCALCRFGIEYVEDPATYEWIPTCHRASFDSFLEDVDYKAAVEHSDGITRRQYMKDAVKIAEVQRGILATSQNEEPFDVFICYKESDAEGNRTRDSIMAQDIYYQLTEQGHRVFFSRITLEDKAGTQYEPYIFAALNSAKVMVVVGTKPDHLNAVWVKNEWSRFLALMRKDRNKIILPCYRDMDPYDMPEQLSVLQSYDMSKIGFIQDLIRGINKVLAADQKPEPVKVPVQAVSAGPVSTNHDSAIIMGFMDLEMDKKDSAAATFRQVLMQDATCAEAYLGMLLVSKESDQPAYREKFEQFASAKMSDLEKKVLTDKTRDSLLHQYCRLSKVGRLSELLDGMKGSITDELFISTISEYPRAEIVKAFVDHGCNVNLIRDVTYSDGKGKVPLLIDLIWNNQSIDAIRTVLNCGADANSIRVFTGKTGQTQEDSALFISIWKRKDPAIVELLLEHGADASFVYRGCFNDGTYEEKSLLNYAVLENQYKIAHLLLTHGANPNAERLRRNKNGDSTYSVLYDTVWKHGNAKMTELLLKNGADTSYMAKIYGDNGIYEELSSLSRAVMGGLTDTVRILLNHRADPNSKRLYHNQYGDCHISPLGDAINKACSPEIVELLLQHGVDPSATEAVWLGDGKLELQCMLIYAVNAKKWAAKLCKLLLDHGASMETIVEYKGKKIPLKRYPFDPPYPINNYLKNAGWKGPGWFGIR